jgi:hypothetical protein
MERSLLSMLEVEKDLVRRYNEAEYELVNGNLKDKDIEYHTGIKKMCTNKLIEVRQEIKNRLGIKN